MTREEKIDAKIDALVKSLIEKPTPAPVPLRVDEINGVPRVFYLMLSSKTAKRLMTMFKRADPSK
jgi:hypothetical protein